MAPLNKIEGFKKTYGDKTLVYPAMHIRKRIQLITGANGSGKTTYFKCLSGCISTDRGFLKHDYLLCIEGDALPAHLRVGVYLEMLSAFESEPTELKRLIRHFEITPFLNERISTLSRGMAQRVALVGSFLMNGSTLLLDEPMRGLDPYYKIQLIKWLENSPLKMMITTHEPTAYDALDCEVHAFETTPRI